MDEKAYRHTEVFYFYLTWRDPAAYAQIKERTAQWKASNDTCSLQCADYVSNIDCCDSIFLPALTFRTVYCAWRRRWGRWTLCRGLQGGGKLLPLPDEHVRLQGAVGVAANRGVGG